MNFLSTRGKDILQRKPGSLFTFVVLPPTLVSRPVPLTTLSLRLHYRLSSDAGNEPAACHFRSFPLLRDRAVFPDDRFAQFVRGHIEDADGGGDDDLVLYFHTQEAGIQCGALRPP